MSIRLLEAKKLTTYEALSVYSVATYLLHKCAKFTKFFQYRLVGNRFDVFHMVERLTLLIPGNTSSRLTRVNTLQDAETTKVLDSNL